MSNTMKIRLSPLSVASARKGIDRYISLLSPKSKEVCRRLAEKGRAYAQFSYAFAQYDGDRNVNVSVEPKGLRSFQIVASGKDALFIEFGAGVTYGYGHPEASAMGYGPGTYPPTNPMRPWWNSQYGWWIPGSGIHTYGNPPSMTMYWTGKNLRNEIESTAKEVFSE